VRGGEKVCEKRGRERMWVRENVWERERKRGGEREERERREWSFRPGNPSTTRNLIIFF
jgi:hypothetical protein